MKLRELLEGVACTGIRWPEEEDFDQEITGITSDSRKWQLEACLCVSGGSWQTGTNI